MIRRYLPLSLALAAAVAGCLLTPAAQARAVEEADAPARAWQVQAGVTDRLIVKYRSGSGAFPTVGAQRAAEVAGNRHGVRISALRQMGSGAQVYRLSRAMGQAEAEVLAASLRSGDANVEFAEPDRLLHPMLVTDDAMLAQQWSLSDATAGIRAPAAWDRAIGTGIVVAVIDTGVRPHADLVANLLPGYDFITDTQVAADGNGRDADAYDPGDAAAAGVCGSGTAASKSSWHGTHVAGIVAAAARNGAGIAGVAFGARILPLRALGRCGGYTSDIADAVTWGAGGSVSGLPANANPARVINLSLGSTGSCSQTMQNAINGARAKGAVVVVAAGNSNADAATASPANCAGVVVVAATGKTGGKASYSNTGALVTLAAPGGDTGAGILSTLNAGTTVPAADSYASYMGTSMATPVVSGIAALMLSANKNLTPDQVAAMLKSSARAFPAACAKCGAGLADASAAVALAAAGAGSSTPAPAPTPTPTPVVTPAPAPAPVVATVAELEPNDTLAKAQVLAAVPAKVAGTIATTTDLDHFKVSVPAGKKLTATLSAGATSGFGLAVYNASGQALLVVPGVVGRQQQVVITNSGSTPVSLALRISRSSGATGAYQLGLAY